MCAGDGGKLKSSICDDGDDDVGDGRGSRGGNVVGDSVQDIGH